MKKVVGSCAGLLLTVVLTAQQWPAVQPEARPGSRWWWLGSAVDTSNISYNLDQYSKAGLGALEITPIYGVKGNDANDLKFLSPEWMQMLKHTEAEGRRTGISIAMNTGTGWPFGGPQVSIDDAATRAIFQEYRVKGGDDVLLDVQVQDARQRDYATLGCVMAYHPSGKKINLTSKMSDGVLRWKAPAGEWKVIVLYLGKTRQMVKRAAPGGEGYVVNHFDKAAVKRYFDRFDRAFAGSEVEFPKVFFNDSYEVYQADWTPGLLEEFFKRRGYRLEEFFPEFLDTARPEISTRIVSDYRETISDLLLENFTRHWTAWAHSHGSRTRNQAHGSPANLIDTYAAVDIPECEGFGLSPFPIRGLRNDSLTKRNDSDLSMLKYAASAAHIAGKPLTSSESFTWLTEHFRTSLAQCKPDMDLLFVSGVNHMHFHGTPYSPKEAQWPGWLFYASVNMSPSNTIWRDAPAFFRYITRCQSFLQMGRPDNDFLVYLPVYDMWSEQPGRLLMFDIHKMEERAPRFIKTIHEIYSAGYDVDYISDAFVRSTSVKNKQLITEGGSTYKALIVPSVKRIPPDVLARLVSLARQGATVLFMDQYPSDVPGFGNLQKRQKELQKLLKQLPAAGDFSAVKTTSLGKGRIITGSDYHAALLSTNVRPETMKLEQGLHCIRRVNDSGHHYFIASLKENDTDGWITLAVDAKSAMIFDPLTGDKGKADTRLNEGKFQVRLQLPSGASVVVQTFAHDVAAENWKYYRPQTWSMNLDRGWKLRFTESIPAIPGEFNIDIARSWTTLDHPDAKINRGTATYTLQFELPDVKADEWMLDLGDVRESARVRVNGHEAGTLWSVPYRIGIGSLLKPGAVNLLEVEVTNLPANNIAHLDRQKVAWRNFKEINMVDLKYRPSDYSGWEVMPSGLNSTVKLVPMIKN
ncbi:MAG: glycosyl hydrolase family 2 [Paludibacter sp. 47-17]|nr:MAG: glycosyl hydrolase family 2 [Paludibacter sp. 47-17]